MKQKINIWEGVYNCWEEAPGDDDVFEGKVWVDKVTSRAQKALAAYRSNETVSRAALNKDYILSVAGAMLLSSIDGNLCVLDFGGEPLDITPLFCLICNKGGGKSKELQ